MSLYEDQMDSSEAICPYCKSSWTVESEDYCATDRTKTCEECGKKYNFYQEFSVDHITQPDCKLNDEEHDWQPVELPDNRVHPFCATCGKCQPLPRLTDDKPTGIG